MPTCKNFNTKDLQLTREALIGRKSATNLER